MTTTIKIGDWEFDWASYDREHDVLYLSAGEPRPGYGEETPEGHILRYDEHGDFYGMTLIGVRQTISERGLLRVTGMPRRLPRGEEIDARELKPALC